MACPSYPTVASSESPHFQHEQGTTPSAYLPSLPHAIGTPSSGLHCDTPALCRHLLPQACPLHSIRLPDGHRRGSGHLRQSSQQSASFHSLLLPPPPSATGLSMSSAGVPAERRHRNRSGVGGWDMEADSVPFALPSQHVLAHAASPPYGHIYASHPLSAHPIILSPLHRSRTRLLGRRTTPSRLDRARCAFRASGRTGIHSNAHAHGSSRHPSVARIGYDNVGCEDIRDDARKLVRDAKECERRGREYASSRQHHHAPGVDYHPNVALQVPNVGAVARAHRPSRSRANGSRVSGARRRSVSRGSWSIEEMLLDTTMDREGGRRRDDGARLSPILGADPLREPPTTSSTHSANGDARVNGLSPNANGNENVMVNVSGNGINGAGMCPGGGGAKASVPSSQLVTLGPGGVVVSGGGAPQAAALPSGGFPAQNAQGQRICRQCGVPGRYKDKNAADRGTLDSVSASQQAQMIAHRSSHPVLVHSQSQYVLAHSAGQSQHAPVGAARARTRQGTPLVEHHTGCTQTQAQLLSPRPASHYREHERDQESRTDSSRSHPSSPVSAYASAAASGRLHPAESAHLSQGQAYSSAATNMKASGLASQASHRLPPTLSHINSTYTREQYANGSSSRALPHQHSQSNARSVTAVTGGGTGNRG
ncbi:hypothetical protein DFH11DRAFT_1728322 [Phellopilus nigrolimitatus]|nr:hypothetical protein DFH11DRAFT_1728322 [Phellopilus nigrolimitatus]